MVEGACGRRNRGSDNHRDLTPARNNVRPNHRLQPTAWISSYQDLRNEHAAAEAQTLNRRNKRTENQPTISLTTMRQHVRHSYWLVSLLGLVAGGCVLFTDAATRLGSDVVENAVSLRADSRSERAFTHVPRAWPEGCGADYTVTFQESLHHPATGGSLLVGCRGESNFQTLGYSYNTTSHLNAVRVPHALSVEKKGGSALEVTLRKHGAAIEVTALR